MRGFSTWLLIIDNVVDLKTVRLFWPSSGSNEHGDGHVLVTTQDSDAIPNDALHSWSMCLSRGMNSEDAVTLLTDASQMKDCKDVEKVAEALKVLRPVDDLFLCVRLSSRTWRCDVVGGVAGPRTWRKRSTSSSNANFSFSYFTSSNSLSKSCCFLSEGEGCPRTGPRAGSSSWN